MSSWLAYSTRAWTFDSRIPSPALLWTRGQKRVPCFVSLAASVTRLPAQVLEAVIALLWWHEFPESPAQDVAAVFRGGICPRQPLLPRPRHLRCPSEP